MCVCVCVCVKVYFNELVQVIVEAWQVQTLIEKTGRLDSQAVLFKSKSIHAGNLKASVTV